MKFILLLVTLFSLSITSCKTTPTSPDSFYQAVVTCTESNTSNAQAGAAVVSCLTNAVGGDYSACLAGLVTGGYWTVQEVACLVRAYSVSTAQKLNAVGGTPADQQGVQNANEWLAGKRIQFRRATP
jgi:hypothetical protein